MSRVLIVGCGDIGIRLGLKLVDSGHEVWGLRRNTNDIPSPITPLQADLSRPETLTIIPPQLDWIYVILTADRFEDQSYKRSYVDSTRNLLSCLAERNEKTGRIVFVSSTGVYGQLNGEWVDESSPTVPASFSGCRILEAEGLITNSPIPSTCVRFAGIYSRDRASFVERVRNRKVCFSTETPTYRNLIHRADAVGILKHFISVPALAPIYIGVDNEPVDTVELVRWISARLGDSARKVESTKANVRRRGFTNKRCSNKKILGTGYEFLYPSFREGYGEILQAVQFLDDFESSS